MMMLVIGLLPPPPTFLCVGDRQTEAGENM
jgi:hypothetical protein